MNNSMRKKIVVVAAIAIASIMVANFATAVNSNAGRYQCGVFAEVYGYGAWIELAPGYQTLLSIHLPNVPIWAYYHVVCDGYAMIDAVEIEVAMGVDAPVEDATTRRFYSDESLGKNFNGIHTERLYYLGPGMHSFYFLAQIYQGVGVSRVNYHTITVTIFTDGSLTEHMATAGMGTPDGTL